MSVYVFALGIKAANGLVKSTINTANSFSEKGIDVNIINILGQNGGVEFLDPAFPLYEKVNRYSLDAISQKISENNDENFIFHEENQQFLKAKYHLGHKKSLQLINSTLTEKDLIIFSHPLAMVLFIKANPEILAKTVIQIHGNYLEETDNLNLLREYCNKVDYLQTVSDHMKDDLLQVLNVEPEKIKCIFNITRPIIIKKVESKLTKRISIIGSIQSRKNQLDAVKMLSLISDRNVVLQIYGKPLKQEYMSLINSHVKLLGLTDRVLFKGLASEKEIYENTDVAIMTSEHEGFPYIFMESAVYGIPIVAYDFKHGAREFSDNNANHCLIPIGDYKGMAKVVEKLLIDDNFYNEVTTINKTRFDTTYAEHLILKDYNALYCESSNNTTISDVIEKSSNISPMNFENITCEPKNRSKIPAWGVDEKDAIQEAYYEISFEVEKLPNDAKFSFVYKKSLFSVKHEIKQPVKSIRRPGFKRKTVDISRKIIVTLCIPVKNRLSMNSIMPNFDVVMISKKEGRKFVCSVSNGIVGSSSNNISRNLSEEYSGNAPLSKITTLLRPDGFWIRYPSFDAIRCIKNEKSEPLKYETRIIRFYGKDLPFFKVIDGLFSSLSIVMNNGKELNISFREYTYKNVFEKLIEIEKRLDLFDLQVAGTYAWELVRANLFESILEAVGVLDKHFSKLTSTQNVYFGSKSMVGLPKSKRLIFEFPRHSGVDFKTKAIQEQFADDSIVLEYPQATGYSDLAYKENSNHFPIKDFLDYSKKYSKAITFNSNDKRVINWLKHQLIEVFGLEIELSIFFSHRISKFKCEFDYFDAFFKLNRFDEVLIPSAYWSAGIVAAARKNKIIASDIQYAIISKYHPSFAFPVSGRAYGADRAYIWSKYWNIKEAPYNKTITSQFNYLKYRLRSLDIDSLDTLKVDYDVCFASQSRIGKIMFENAFKYASNNPDKQVIFCPHPDEDASMYNGYCESCSMDNFHINDKEDTLTIVSKSDCVVGVYSTSIIEALALNKKTCCLKVNGFEVFEREIQKGHLKLLSSIDDLNDFLGEEQKDVNYSNLFYNTLFLAD
ncbi:hypothetical protein BCT30_21540 [Enterovibrio norvegicus]|uniref:glycosyltransferase family 4 protein n=1 Tax=Enterovibrio norvegicus TaxID=188144 RepID=UPI000C836CD2|nr:glycosyltransferase family 4 protein [Enterovibrio norvegicus]PMI35240.1 hypothetical protein BCU46_19065 [Enterovibrio norvegicus]PMN47118.1 hypothetical protein BCT30_21540 [Enterovibrio norvegicus]